MQAITTIGFDIAKSYRLRLIDSWDFLGFTTGIEAVSFRRHDSVGGQGS
jgi:hypothetical protein